MCHKYATFTIEVSMSWNLYIFLVYSVLRNVQKLVQDLCTEMYIAPQQRHIPMQRTGREAPCNNNHADGPLSFSLTQILKQKDLSNLNVSDLRSPLQGGLCPQRESIKFGGKNIPVGSDGCPVLLLSQQMSSFI